MNVKLLTEQHLEFLRLKGGCTGSSESIHVKMPHSWKSQVMAQKWVSIASATDWDDLLICSEYVVYFVIDVLKYCFIYLRSFWVRSILAARESHGHHVHSPIWIRQYVIKLFFILNRTEHELYPAS